MVHSKTVLGTSVCLIPIFGRSSSLDQFIEFWRSLYPEFDVQKVPSFENALELAKEIMAEKGSVHVLVTGRSHLVVTLFASYVEGQHSILITRQLDEARGGINSLPYIRLLFDYRELYA